MFSFEFLQNNKDTTKSYELVLDRPYKISEFISELLRIKINDYGTIVILEDDKDLRDQTPYCTYSSGKLTYSKITYHYLDKYISTITVKSSLHRMDYTIHIRTD